MKMQSIDLVAANFRNAMFEATEMNLFEIDDSNYDAFDAQMLECCYRIVDNMPEENITNYAQCISMGAEIMYDIEKEDFYVIL